MREPITDELIERALCGIDERFVQEMLMAHKLDRTAVKRAIKVAVPIVATAAVVALCFGLGVGRGRMINVSDNPLLK